MLHLMWIRFPPMHVHLGGLSVSLGVLVCDSGAYELFKYVLERISLPLWMCVSKIVMRCQLDSSELITGCTLGVSVSLTHSHMLFPVLIFDLAVSCSLPTPCTSLVCTFSLPLPLALLLHLCFSDVDHLPPLFVNLNSPS